jgi:O-antigen ligase
VQSTDSTMPQPANPRTTLFSAGTLAHGGSDSTLRRARRPRRMIAVDQPRWFLRWALYSFMFALPFEAVPLGIPATPSKLAGFVLFLAALRQPRLCFGDWCAALVAFSAYTFVFTLRALPYLARYPGETIGRLSMLWQMLVLFWLSANVLRFGRVADRALLCLGLGCALLSGLLLLGIGKTTVAYYGLPRLSAFGWNPNELAALLSFGVLCLVGLTAKGASPRRTLRVMVLPAMLVVTAAIVQTGSRSGLLALIAGLLVFAFGRMRPAVRIGIAVLLCLSFASTAALIARSKTALFRWQATFERGDVTGRDALFNAAWGMFQDAPVLGWGPINNTYELAQRAVSAAPEVAIDPHNLALSILTESGLVGGALFLAAVLLCVQAAWRAHGREMLPLALTLALLVMCSSGVWQYRKPFWLVLGYAIAAGAGRRVAHGVQTWLPKATGKVRLRRAAVAAPPALGKQVDRRIRSEVRCPH